MTLDEADKIVKRVQRYARLVRDQGWRAMPKLDESLRNLMRQLDAIHEETIAMRTPPGAISPYGQRRIEEADRALSDLHAFVRDPVAFAQRARVRYGFEVGGSDDIAIRASDVASNAFQGVRAARTIVASARRAQARDPKLDKRALWKDIERSRRQKDRQTIARLKADVQRAREERARAIKQAQRKCTRDRKRALREGQRLRERAKARARQMREQARGSCQLGRAYAKGTRETIEGKRAALAREQQHQREMRAIERSRRSRLAKTRGPGPTRMRAREIQSESDDEVRQNIDPSLIPLFERVKRGIRASPRMSRTEAFMQYVEEHPREVDDAIEDATDALIAQLERRQRTGTDVARDSSRRYIVYVAKVQNTSVPTYYVGSTARGLRLRRRQHRGGLMARRHCLEKLVPVMRTETRDEAEVGEAQVARALRRLGYTVHGDH